MKNKRSKHYLVLIPTLTVLFYLMQNDLGLSDIASGIVTGGGFGLAVLAIIAAKKGIKKPKSFKGNVKRKLSNN